ncbi:MAG: PAS domain S-box protein [Candidatus Cloacimonetes bacterium]|nr:PAS domain S-box protein [Candidatus Cloacimonadota bacterium]
MDTDETTINSSETGNSAEEILKKSEERFRSYIENAPDGIFIADENGNYVDVNPAAEKITGYSRQELLGMNLKQLLPEEAVQGSVERFRKVVATGNASGDSLFKRKDGTIGFWTIKAVKLSPNRFLGFVNDITQRRAMEQELLKAKETAERYLNLAGSIILSLDTNANITLINKKGLSILEYSREELIGKNWFDVCLPLSVRDRVKKVFASIVSGALESLDYYENEVVTKSGRIRLIFWYNTILRNSDNEIEFVLSSGEDITDRRKTEMELSKYQEHLEELVEDRTAELEQKNAELQRYNNLFIGREFRIKELRDRVKELEEKLDLTQ